MPRGRDPATAPESLLAAQLHFEVGLSVEETAAQLAILTGRPVSRQRVTRLLQAGRDDRFWRIRVEPMMPDGAVEENVALGEQLTAKFELVQSKVIRVLDRETISAIREDHFLLPERSYRSSDVLHGHLGRTAAHVLLELMNGGGLVGLAAGRGVRYTVDAVASLPETDRALDAADEISLVSLSGGARVGPWDRAELFDLDADAGTQVLGHALGLPTNQIDLRFAYVAATDPHDFLRRLNARLESQPLKLAVCGLGTLNTGHNFLRESLQLAEAIVEPLQVIARAVSVDPWLVADVAHRLFWIGSSQPPGQVREAIAEVNSRLIAVRAEDLRRAQSVLLICGGFQKLQALKRLLGGHCPDAPIRTKSITFVTDEWTANELLRAEA